ncbi:MAG: DUF559 domain-containing protein [Acidimicrobiia bacterium]|nr:DUF559 domain-containing protein [Acidimicrobiia bacterium]
MPLDPVQREQARTMRHSLTRSELDLWRRIRARQLGVKFRRQHPIGPYIVDFACVPAKVVIEIDGGTHQDRTREAIRDAELAERGWTVIHFNNTDLEFRFEVVLAVIERAVSAARQPPTESKRDRSKG